MLSVETGLKNYEVLLKVGIESNERRIKCKVRINITVERKVVKMPSTLEESIDYSVLKNIIDKTRNIELELLEQFIELWLSETENTFSELKKIFICIEKIDAPIESLHKGIPFVSIKKEY